MSESRLCEKIKQNLEAQDIEFSDTEIQNLWGSVLTNLSEILDKGDIVDISDFGLFWRKENSTSTFYKPAEGVLERINLTK